MDKFLSGGEPEGGGLKMTPRLVGVDGPLKGEVFAIASEEVLIGRDPASALCVADPSISRRHCSIHRLEAGGVRIVDLNSRNGTFVNGLPVGERALEHGDEIQLGSCLFVFLAREEEEIGVPGAILHVEPDQETRTEIQLRREEAVYLKPEEALVSPAAPVRVARNLKALLRMSTAIRATRGVEALAGELLELTFDTVPASEGAILLFEPGLAEPAWSFGWERESGPVERVRVRSELVERSCRDQVAILSNEVSDRPPRKRDHTTTVRRPVTSVIAVPLAGSETTLGVLYLGSADPRVSFDEEHLQLVTAIGCVSGLALENALHIDRLNAENRRLRQEIDLEHDMVGECPRMQRVYRFIAKVAPTDCTVLIAGESGTGKELVARAIHRNSPRSAKPFVAINCAALTETLLESELFGHERGAFTGAVALKKGKFEVADGGTLFLDEIGELPPAIQVKLLRALQEREFERVGGTRSVRVDVRVIAATNRDLRAATAAGAFHEALYYRLNVVALEMPALRDRRKDIPLLATHFVAKYGKRLGRKPAGISAEARACLLNYDWPGNVRELENAIERAVVLGSGDRILLEDLPEAVVEFAGPASAAPGGYHEAIRRQKRRLILKAIEQAGGSQREAAKILGVNPTYLSRLIRSLNLKSDAKTSGR